MGLPGGTLIKNPPAMQDVQETCIRSPGPEDPLEEEMAAHSSILAWKVPWTEKPEGFESLGPRRFGQD